MESRKSVAEPQYNNEDRVQQERVGEDALSELSKMMNAMLAERELREADQREERQRWEIERQNREEEALRREEQTRMHLAMLETLVHGVQLQGEAAKRRADNGKDVHVPKLTEEDDIVSYLTMFERLMIAYEVSQDKWVYKLAANLVGKAQEGYAALSLEEAKNYNMVKEAIL